MGLVDIRGNDTDELRIGEIHADGGSILDDVGTRNHPALGPVALYKKACSRRGPAGVNVVPSGNRSNERYGLLVARLIHWLSPKGRSKQKDGGNIHGLASVRALSSSTILRSFFPFLRFASITARKAAGTIR